MSMYRPSAAPTAAASVARYTEWPRDAHLKPGRASTLYGRRTFLFCSESTGDNR